MSSKETFIKLYELLDKQIEKIVAKHDITPSELENVSKAITLMCKLDDMGYGEDYEEAGYSRDRGRSPVTGRYVSRDGSMRNNRSGHSIHDRAISKLEQMMDETNSDYEKSEISKMIRELEMNK